MTREEAIQKHRKMWNWLADNPGRRKEDYLNKFDPKAELEGDCYLCDYTVKQHNGSCEECLVEWPVGHCIVASEEPYNRGLYSKWDYYMVTDNYEIATKIARQIAELPERKETV